MSSKDYLTVWREISLRFKEIGMIIPSSRYFARQMIRPVIRNRQKPQNILEVGPGTGPFTKEILRVMKPEDRFTICEINQGFLDRLKEGLKDNSDYLKNRDRVIFHLGPIVDFYRENPDLKFDSIVTSLPFNNFSPEVVREHLEVFKNLLTPGGSFTFCEYFGVRRLAMFVSKGDKLERLKGVDGIMQKWSSNNSTNQTKVKKTISLLNVPPAVTIECICGSDASLNVFSESKTINS